MKLISLGKLSSNGPRLPCGYQMKWPMPSEAKSSPSFHAVRPATVPLHSFCQIFFPIRSASACDRATTARACAGTVATAHTKAREARQTRQGRRPSCFLDGYGLSISVALPPALELKDRTGKSHSYET